MLEETTRGSWSRRRRIRGDPDQSSGPFADCPLANKTINDCIFAQTKSGGFTVGKKTVPIVNTITLQGGFIGTEGNLKFVAAEDGNTLSKTAQPVPGGLLGIVAPSFLPKFLQELFNEFINKGITGATATTELAAPASTDHSVPSGGYCRW